MDFGLGRGRRQARRHAIAVLLSLAVASPAWSCSVKWTDDLITLDDTWRAEFGKQFEQATGAYVVRVKSAGKFDDERRASCDQWIGPPPPPPARANRKQRDEYVAMERAAAAANVECGAEKVSVYVIERIKGPALGGWVETYALVQIVEGPPKEPVSWYGKAPSYGSKVRVSPMGGPCDGANELVRRMSVDTPYIVLTGKHPITETPYIARAFWADPSTPFLAEARRLGAQLK